MRDAFHEQLDSITEQLVGMTRLAGSAMARATTALLDADLHLAEDVITGDRTLDHAREHLDGISDSAIAELNIPTGQPLVYDIGTDFMPTGPGTYLDPEAAAAAAAAVANQGR